MWLNVPNLKLVTFECLLAQQAQVGYLRHHTLRLRSEASSMTSLLNQVAVQVTQFWIYLF